MDLLLPLGWILGSGVEPFNLLQMVVNLSPSRSVDADNGRNLGVHHFLQERRVKVSGIQSHKLDRIVVRGTFLHPYSPSHAESIY